MPALNTVSSIMGLIMVILAKVPLVINQTLTVSFGNFANEVFAIVSYVQDP